MSGYKDQVLGKVALTVKKVLSRLGISKGASFQGSKSYWEHRYMAGGDSGAGSYNNLASFKAETVNRIVRVERVHSVIEFGCGDGNQLALLDVEDYIGVDVSAEAIGRCRKKFAENARRTFHLSTEFDRNMKGDLVLSLDVIYHLIEEDVFVSYMSDLFAASRHLVLIYASNIEQAEFEQRYDLPMSPHVFHRRFIDWIDTNQSSWTLLQKIPNVYPFDVNLPDRTSFADFYLFKCLR